MAVIEDNIQELENQIMEAVDFYDEDLGKKLAKYVADIKRQLLNGDFKNRTGDLRRSIRVKLIDYSSSISMLNYGYYLSFGVKGRNNQTALGLEPEVASSFGVAEGYKFGSNKVAGIKPRKFYPNDLEEKLLEILIEE